MQKKDNFVFTVDIYKFIPNTKGESLMQMKSYCSVGGDTPHTLEIYARQFLFWMTEEIQMKKLSVLTSEINQF